MIITINAVKGISPTIKSNYYKTSLANFVRGGQRFYTCGVLEVPEGKWVENITNKELTKAEENIE